MRRTRGVAWSLARCCSSGSGGGMVIRNAGRARSGSRGSLEVTDEWVCDANKGPPQAKSTTLPPKPGAVRSCADPASVRAKCQPNSWCQPAGSRMDLWILWNLCPASNSATKANLSDPKCHYFRRRRGGAGGQQCPCTWPRTLADSFCALLGAGGRFHLRAVKAPTPYRRM